MAIVLQPSRFIASTAAIHFHIYKCITISSTDAPTFDNSENMFLLNVIDLFVLVDMR